MSHARKTLFNVQGPPCATYASIRVIIARRFVPFFIFCGLLYGWCTLTPAEAQLPWDRQLPQVPEVKAQMVGQTFVAGASGPTTLRIAVEIPPDHHGYLDQGDDGMLIPFAFTFPAFVERGVQVVMLSHPAGVRDAKVRATVLRGSGEFVFRLDTQGVTLPTAEPLSALLRYQICNDVTKVCYPPQDREVPLHFASVAGQEAPSTPPAPTETRPIASLTMSEHVAAWFQRSRQHVPLALVVVFAAGLLASATPCVYPLLPVTSAILMARGRDSRRRGLWHTGVYCLGIVFFYAALGFLAATTGTALSVVMTSAWVTLGFAMVFAYFGLSMLGLYEFHLSSFLATQLETATSRRGGLTGTFLMGTTAGLGVSPCIGPVVGAILLEITGQTAGASGASNGVTTGGMLHGIALMTSFGVGLGLPFLVVGMLSNRVGQAGPWLTKIKFILGLPIGGVGGQPFLPLFAIYAPQGGLAWKGQNYEAVETMVTQLAQAQRTATP